MHLGAHPSDDEILRFVESWIDDLARRDYQAAFDKTAHDPYYQWTPDLMRMVIEGYGLPEPRRDRRVFHVTDRQTATGKPPQRIVDREDPRPPSFAEVWYDLPLNGEWSDLTATFRVERHGQDSVVTLEQIHVF
jgi:hypothetical protein